MNPIKIDLHTHTTFSDGRLTPEKLLQLAVKRKISHLAVTDHDTVASFPIVRKLCEDAKIGWIPGIEISCRCREEEVHLLAYYFDEHDPDLKKFLSNQSSERIVRVGQMIQALNEAGILLRREDVDLHIQDPSNPGRLHVALGLIRAGYAPDVETAFQRYLVSGRPGFVSRRLPEAEDVIRNVLAWGGVPVLAHPGRLRDRSISEEIVPWGLKGIEAYHPSHKKSEMKAFAHWAEEKNLIVTGGSDFHGVKGEKNAALGSLPVPADTVARLQGASSSRGGA